ncbi:MAG TPA: ATP-dependent DNA ligase [Nakamurella sp.]|jgi:DNA ligase 1
MLFRMLADASAGMAATRSRIAKRGLIVEALRQADPSEIALVATYLSGSVRQRRTGVGWASVGDPPPPAVEPTLTVVEVDDRLERIAAEAGAGSAARRSVAVGELFGAATDAEQSFLRGLITEDVRQGASDAAVQDGLAVAFGVPLAEVLRAAMLLGSTAETAELLAAGGAAALAGVGLRLGRPIRPMLAASAPDVAGALTRTGLPAVVDAKLDGIRVQVHKDGATVRVFTRSLDEITARVPEIVARVAEIPLDTAVIDGEALALDEAGAPRPFQVTAARSASAADPDRAGDIPLNLFCFDLLHLNGVDLLDLPLADRAAAMTSALPADLLVPRRLAATAAEVAEAFADAVAGRYEGIVVKDPGARYAAGRRDPAWVKLKPRHTLDLAVIAAEWGYGRRTGWLSNLHLAARDPAGGGWVMLGKTFKGLTDTTLRWQTAEILAREVRRTRAAVYPDPPLVAEIAFDGLQASTRYPGAVALRFARVLRYREDKTPAEVDTLATVLALAGPARFPADDEAGESE